MYHPWFDNVDKSSHQDDLEMTRPMACCQPWYCSSTVTSMPRSVHCERRQGAARDGSSLSTGTLSPSPQKENLFAMSKIDTLLPLSSICHFDAEFLSTEAGSHKHSECWVSAPERRDAVSLMDSSRLVHRARFARKFLLRRDLRTLALDVSRRPESTSGSCSFQH